MNLPNVSSALSRREFIQRTAVGSTAALAFGPSFLRAAGEGSPAPAPSTLFRVMGVAAPLARAGEVKTAGANYLVESVSGLLMPEKSDADFTAKLAELAHAPLPVKACNSFLRDKALRCVGPDANHALVLDWSRTTFRRARQAGLEFIVFGSGGARQVPDGWSFAKADEQFIALLKAMGPLAAAEGITVAVEPLQQRECNYLMRLSDVARIIRAADHPHVRALADLYHMANMGETPADLAAALPVVYWVEIAEKVQRTAPGVSGDDFRPFFAELARARYAGGITIEGKWTPAQLKTGFETIRQQADEAAHQAM